MKFASLVVFVALLLPSAASEPQEQEQEQEQEQNEPPCVYPSSDYPDCSAIDQEQLPTNAYDPAACVAKSCGQCYFDHSSGDGPGGWCGHPGSGGRGGPLPGGKGGMT